MYTHFCHVAFILALCMLLVSCGPAPQGERMPIPSANRSQPTSTSAATKTRAASAMSSATQGLPASAAVDVTRKPLLKTLFRNEPNVNRLEDLYATTKGKVESLSVVSNCNLDVLKAFLATGWAPVILSKRQLSVVMKYDDAEQQIQIGNPLSTQRKGPRSRVGRTLTYSEFGREWSTGSGNKCVLITPRRLSDVEIHTCLEKVPP